MRVVPSFAVFAVLLAAAGLAMAQDAPPPPASTVASSGGVGTGFWRGGPVTYAIVGGRKVFQGDILLDGVTTAPAAGPRPFAVGVAYGRYLWPKNGGVAEVPYKISQGSANLAPAIAEFNATFAGVIQLVPLAAQPDYVNFNLDPLNLSGACASFEGHVGGGQDIDGSGACAIATLLHEMGHAIGLYHEHVRPDRNSYVRVNYGAVIKGSQGNFDILDNNALAQGFQTTGLYDYASVMHYPPYAFSRNGLATVESIPVGLPLSNASGYSDADIDAVLRLYGAAPTSVTIATNPPGLAVVVDGMRYVAPHKFSGPSWALGTNHVIAVPAGPQTLAGSPYVFARWNDLLAGSHTISVAAGRGTAAAPKTSPAVTVYSANFAQLVHASTAASPPGSGTVAAAPAPVAYPSLGGQAYYVARQPVTLTATPASGFSFLQWGNANPPYLAAPYGANPKRDYAPGDVVATFTDQPVTTVTTFPPGHWMTVDGNFAFGPQNYVWAAGSAHSVSVPSPQLPYSFNTRFVYARWSDRGLKTHNVTAPAVSSALTAFFTPQFAPVASATPSCAAGVALSPLSPKGDGFYNAGTIVTVAANVAQDFTLVGWRGDLAGTANPQTLKIIDEELAVADLNLNATPFAVTGLSPPSAAAGGGDTAIAINGTGFTPASLAYVNTLYRSSVYVSPTLMNVTLTSADLAAVGAFPVAVGNFSPGGCGQEKPQAFFVTAP